MKFFEFDHPILTSSIAAREGLEGLRNLRDWRAARTGAGGVLEYNIYIVKRKPQKVKWLRWPTGLW